MSAQEELPFEAWLLAVFDPEAEDPWLPPRLDLEHLKRLFDDPATLLEGFTDDDIGGGLWSILDSGGAGTALALNDASLPLAERVACVQSIRRVYTELFVPRCAERLGHQSEQGGRLEMVCYMFWDIACFGGAPDDRDGNLFEDAILDVLDDVLRLPHAGCQESALHGLGHRVSRHRERAPRIIDLWLRRGGARDERLIDYARAAMTGCIQ